MEAAEIKAFGETAPRPLKNLSPSKVEAYLKCPEQFRLRYIEKIPEKSSIFLTSGSIVHAVIEYALTAKRLGEKEPGLKELDDVFESRWKTFTQKEEVKRDFVGWGYKPDDPPDKVKAECRALIPVFMRDLYPTIAPAAIEHDVKYEYPTKYGNVLSWGKLDLMTEDGAVWDWKTTQKISSSATKSFDQFPQYTQFSMEKHGRRDVLVKKAFLVRGENPYVKVYETTLGDEARAKWARAVAYTWEGVTEGKFAPNPKHYLCKAEWCPFYVPCQGWSDLK